MKRARTRLGHALLAGGLVLALTNARLPFGRAASEAPNGAARAAMHSVEGVTPVRAELLLDVSALPPGEEAKLAVVLDIAPGWHIYAPPLTPFGSGTKLALLGNAIAFGPPAFARPEAFAQVDGATAMGYARGTAIAAPWRIVADAARGLGSVTITANVSLLACKVLCVPGHLSVSKTVLLAGERQPADARSRAAIEASSRAAGPLPADWLSPLAAPNHVAAGHEAAAERQLSAPSPAGPAAEAQAAALVQKALGGASTAKPPSGALALWQALAFAFFGGLVLNAMPCVLPVLIVKAAGLSLLGDNPAKRRRHALLYATGTVGSMVVLALAAASLRLAGAAVGWGFQMQQPAFLAPLSVVLSLFCAHTFEVFTLSPNVDRLSAAHGRASGASQSLLEGVLAVLVATPCSAPFLGTAVAFAVTEPLAVQLLAFVAIGLGLALPYVALALVPHSRRWLPRPGPWMLGVKYVLGYALFGTVLWLVWLYAAVAGTSPLLGLLVLLWLTAAGAALLGALCRRRPERTGVGLAVLLSLLAAAGFGLGTARPVAGEGGRASPASGGGVGTSWQPWSDAAVQRTLGLGQPVLVEFTADWCVTCQYNETVLRSPAVVRALGEHNVALFVADWTREDRTILEALERAGRVGVPLTLLYAPARPSAPARLPEILSAAKLLEALAALPQ